MQFSAAIVVSAALALAGQASAQTPPVDGPVSTAPVGGGSPLSTQQQIDQYLEPSAETNGGVDTGDTGAERRIHGEVSLAVGTGGYRSGSVAAVIPIGETGTLALSYSKSKNDRSDLGYGRRGYGYDSLSSPLATEAECGTLRTEPGRYAGPPRGSLSPATAERCMAPN